MTFPDTSLDIRVQLFLLGEWVDMGPVVTVVDDFFTDVFTDVFLGRNRTDNRRLPAQPIRIDAGRRDEFTATDPSQVSLILWNEDGYLTPDDPRSPWWSEQPGGWGLNTPLRILVDDDEVFNGEVASIKPVWPEGDLADPTLTDEDLHNLAALELWRLGFAHVQITASGILRRLVQRTKPLRSPLTRLAQYNASFAGRVYGYWPFEDGSDATSIASGLEGKPRVASISGFALASDSSLPGSDPLPKLSAGQDGSWSAVIDAAGLDGHWCIDVWTSFSKAATEPGTFQRIEVHATGDVARWTLDIFHDGTADAMWLRGYDADGDPVPAVERYQQNVSDFYGEMQTLQLRVDGDVWSWLWSTAGGAVLFGFDGTGAGSAGHPTWVGGGFIKAACDITIGHAMARSTSVVAGWAGPAALGYVGDSTIQRIGRLCAEEGVSVVFDSVTVGSTKLGVQKSGDFLGLLQEAADADGGILMEYHQGLGLRYRPRRTRYNPFPVWTIDAKTDGFQNPFEPVRDDQQTLNDLEVQRIDGSKFQRINQASIDKVGTYDGSVSLSLDTDRKGRLKNQAGWRLHQGSYEGTRYPQVTIQIESALDPEAVKASWKLVQIGDAIRIQNLPPQHPVWPDHVDLVVEGSSGTLSPFGWTVTINCSPAEVWHVAVYGVSRYMPRNSRLITAIDDGALLFDVAADGVGWTIKPESFPMAVLVGGAELVTVSGITGSPGDQTFEVTERNVNGLGRAHPSGASVVPYDGHVIAL